MRINRLLACVAVPLVLSACGGGSGGPGGPGGPGTPTAFTKFPFTGTQRITGIGRDVAVTEGDGGVAIGEPATGTVTADVTIGDDDKLTKVTLKTPTINKTWSGSEIDTSGNEGIIFAESSNGQDVLAFADPKDEDMDFAYQTFGAWATGVETNAPKAGAFSVGAQTADANIPTTGTATFTGKAGGIYVAGFGEPEIVTADARLEADFANRNVEFQTTNSSIASLDMTGTMTYAGTSGLSGTVQTLSGANGPLSGTIDGRFYGPGADEVGGTFSLSNSGESFIGGYGAKQ